MSHQRTSVLQILGLK